MAMYQHSENLTWSNHPVFNQTYHPGQLAPFGGLYRCTGCGLEIGIAKGHVLPPQSHHWHVSATPIKWQPLVIHE